MLSPSLPLRSAQGCGSLKDKLREASGCPAREILRFAQDDSQGAQDDSQGAQDDTVRLFNLSRTLLHH